MEYTKNYHLPQWVETDRIMMEDFNQMCADIENGLEAVKSEATERQETLAQNIGASLESITDNLGSGGHTARIAWGSYTGTGTANATNPKKLNFNFCPVLVFVGRTSSGNNSGWPTTMMRPSPYSRHDSSLGDSTAYVTWEDKAVSWYGANDISGSEYCYVAIGYSNS